MHWMRLNISTSRLLWSEMRNVPSNESFQIIGATNMMYGPREGLRPLDSRLRPDEACFSE